MVVSFELWSIPLNGVYTSLSALRSKPCQKAAVVGPSSLPDWPAAEASSDPGLGYAQGDWLQGTSRALQSRL